MTRRPALLALVLWLLRRRLPSEWAEFVLGDLEEEYRRRAGHSRADATVWLIESQAGPGLLASAVRQRVRDFDPDVAAAPLASVDEHVTEVLATERFAAVMLSALAGAGLLLAIVGLYGAISHSVWAQRQEIALRMAVGAARGRVVGMVVREVALVALRGTAAGAIAAALAASGLQAMLYQVKPHDALT